MPFPFLQYHIYKLRAFFLLPSLPRDKELSPNEILYVEEETLRFQLPLLVFISSIYHGI